MPYAFRSSRPRHPVQIPSGLKSYSTNFPLNENPLSEGGLWTCGGAAGIDWTDPLTNAGQCFGLQPNGGTFTDSIANLSGFKPNILSLATIHKDPALSGNTFEVELLFRFAISPHVARGYECNLAFDGGYCQIVRWNGALGDFTMLSDAEGLPVTPQTGDQMEGKMIGNIIVVTHIRSGVRTQLNSVDVTAGAGSALVWNDGNPGVGFWHGDGTGKYGFTSFSTQEQ